MAFGLERAFTPTEAVRSKPEEVLEFGAIKKRLIGFRDAAFARLTDIGWKVLPGEMMRDLTLNRELLGPAEIVIFDANGSGNTRELRLNKALDSFGAEIARKKEKGGIPRMYLDKF